MMASQPTPPLNVPLVYFEGLYLLGLQGILENITQPFGIRIIEHLRYRPFSTFRPFAVRQFRCFTHYFSAQPFAKMGPNSFAQYCAMRME